MESNVVSINSYNTPKQVNIVSEYWKTIIGTRLTPEGERLLNYWRGKVSDEDLFYAIDETALAPNRPSVTPSPYCAASPQRKELPDEKDRHRLQLHAA